MAQSYQVITSFSAAELQKRMAAGEITVEDWSGFDPTYIASQLFSNGGGVPRIDQPPESAAHTSNDDSLDSNDMFTSSTHISSGLPRGESDDADTQSAPATSSAVDETAAFPKKRGRPRILETQKGRKKTEKQQKKAEEEEKRNIALCARYQVVLENNPWQYKRNTLAFNNRWKTIVKVLKDLRLLDHIPNSGRQFQSNVSKALKDYEEVFIKRPTGEEPPEKAEKDRLLGDMYDLKKSGEGPNFEAEDRDVGLAKRKRATLKLGMTTANKASRLRETAEDDENEIPTSEDEAANGTDNGYIGRLNRADTYDLDFAGPEFQESQEDNAGVASQNAAKKKTSVSGQMENLEVGDADVEHTEGVLGANLDSPGSSGSGSNERKRKGDYPVAANRGKKKDVVDAIMCFTDRAKDQGQIQWKVWSGEQRQMELERKFQRELEQQKIALEKERMDRDEESRKKDRELDLQKHLATVSAMKDIFCDFFTKKSSEKSGDA